MIRKESILFVHNGKGLGGAPKALRYIIEACKEDGYKCYVACLECNQTIPYFLKTGAEIIIVDSLPNFTNSTTISYDLNSKHFNREREFAVSYESYWRRVLYEHGPFSLVFLNSMVLCDLIKPSKDAGSKVIQVVRETAQIGPLLEYMKILFGESDAVLFISEYDQELFSIKSTKSIVIPDALDPDLYASMPDERAKLRKQYDITGDDVVLLFTGGFGYIKGGDLLMDSLEMLHTASPVTLIFAGYSGNRGIKSSFKLLLSYLSNSQRFAVERTRRKLDKIINDSQVRVISLGFYEKIHELFKISDISLVPYRVPHQAMPIFEAGMAKIPCLVSDFPCYQYEIENGQNGFLIPVDKPDEWSNKIEYLSKDRQACVLMGLNNYHRAIKRHNIHSNAILLRNFIRTVLNS